MGFTIKQVISSFIMPLPFGILLGLIGLYFLYRNAFFKAKVFLTMGIVVVLLFSYHPVSNTLTNLLENQYQSVTKIDKNIKYALLLGGNFKDRGYEVVKLYNMNPDIIVITSGYEGNNLVSEAAKNKNYLIELGIPAKNIILQTKAKDTKEEALYTRELLQNEQFYLVTSSYHMPRAIAIFNKAELFPIPAPSEYTVKHNKYLSIPSASNAFNSQKAVHEIIGLLWYKLMGYI